ncbi:MAG: tRNA uridine-5-carboxymethylaminomethyl(34) synthesis GTPase MnmE [Betaproteobacteria bacterium]|nr:tRNA uridine-5-carboxymethylaminomethyl(34) synthesis GTPase MnmE [Betaproteobacteria bacterium]
MASPSDTIVAIATAAGPGAVGIVRVSGPATRRVMQAVCGQNLTPRYATLSSFRSCDGDVVDQGLAFFFEAPHSYTGEDVLELQGHGGIAAPQLVQAACLTQSLADCPVRLARPGEFTQRAFLNGKIDLAQAEAVSDLIAAESAQSARAALASLRGAFSDSVHRLQARLTDVRLRAEACLDFPEEGLELSVSEQLGRRLRECEEALAQVVHTAQRGAALTSGLRVVLCGPPNVGKSSLLNVLSGEEAAIVTALPGTTRDRVSRVIHLDGVPIELIDTAGLRETQDPVEQMGIERSWQALKGADLALFLRDASGSIQSDPAQEAGVAQHMGLESGVRDVGRVWVIWNKADLARPEGGRPDELLVSAKTGAGLDELRTRLKARAGWSEGEAGGVLSARTRHLESLRRAQENLSGCAALAQEGSLELFAEQLRLAQLNLSEVTGEFLADDLLGEIFSRFCIGK